MHEHASDSGWSAAWEYNEPIQPDIVIFPPFLFPFTATFSGPPDRRKDV